MKRRTIRKWFWVWEFDQEEKWLNDMAKRGWVLDGVGFAKYDFVESEPGEYCRFIFWIPDEAKKKKELPYFIKEKENNHEQ